MSDLHRTKIVGKFLLEWGASRVSSAAGRAGHCTSVAVFRQANGSWKLDFTMFKGEADELQCALREVVLEIEAAIEKDDEAEAPEPQDESSSPEDLAGPDPSNVDDELKEKQNGEEKES